MVTSERFALCGVHGSPPARPMRAPERPRRAAHVHDIRLHHIHGAHRDHARPDAQVPVLFATGDIERERIGHGFGFIELPVGAGLFIMTDAFGLEQPADFNGAGRRVTAVGVHQFRTQLSPRARATVGTINSVRPGHSSMSRPHSAPTRHLNASKPSSSRSRTRRSASAAGVMSRFIEDARRAAARFSTEQFHHRLAFELAAQIPKRGIKTGECTTAVATGVLVLAL